MEKHIMSVVVALFLATCVSGARFTVAPHSQYSNPGQSSCVTLSHVASNPDQYFPLNTNVRLTLLPGEHTLRSFVLVRNVSTLEIFGSQSNTIVTCSGSGFNVERASFVQFRDITFHGCGGNIIKHVDHFVLKNCDQVRDSRLRLQQVSSAEIAESSFSFSSGGALGVSSSNRTVIKNSSFQHNSAGSGGAMYVSNSDVAVENCVFNYNTASRYGGAIFTSSSTLSIDDSVFDHNEVTGSHGGAVYVEHSNTFFVTLTDSIFIYNTASSDGGAVYSSDNGPLSINNVTFDYNRASRGAGMYTKRSGPITIDNSVFRYNRASSQGGAIYGRRNHGIYTIDDSKFSYNRANERGGGIFLTNTEGSFIIDDSTFEYHSAGSYGGAVYSHNNRALIIDDSVLTYNKAKYSGGALHSGDNAVLTDNTFSDNRPNSVNCDSCVIL